jgi:hypothetical protein
MGLLQEKLQEKATEAMQLYQQLFALRKLLPAELLATQAQVSTALPASSLPMQSARRAWLLLVDAACSLTTEQDTTST